MNLSTSPNLQNPLPYYFPKPLKFAVYIVFTVLIHPHFCPPPGCESCLIVLTSHIVMIHNMFDVKLITPVYLGVETEKGLKGLGEFTSNSSGAVKGNYHAVEPSDIDVSFVFPQN